MKKSRSVDLTADVYVFTFLNSSVPLALNVGEGLRYKRLLFVSLVRGAPSVKTGNSRNR